MRFAIALLLVCCLTVSASAVITGGPTDVAGFVGMSSLGPYNSPQRVTSYAGFVAVFGNSEGLDLPWLGPSVAAFFQNGGAACWIVRSATDADPDLIAALQFLEGIDEVSLVAIPGCNSVTVQSLMIAHCTNAGDRLAILDPAAAADPAAVQAQRAGLGSTDGFATLYFPWVVGAPDGISRALPPSGYVAGAMAATAVADSPVPILLAATGVSWTVTPGEQDALVPIGINPIRFFSGQGVRIWGARTLAVNTEWQYVGVRRLGSWIHEAVVEGTAYATYEPNDFMLWGNLESEVEAFLYAVWQQGFLQGPSPGDAYFVNVGLNTSMTALDILEGRTIIDFGFAPVMPAEFLIDSITIERVSQTAAPEARSSGLTLHRATPNPFNPRTTVSFTLESAGHVAVQIIRADGRHVTTLLSGTRTAGRQELTWNGTDESGQAVASGVYFVRVRAGGEEASGKLVLVR